MKIIKIASLALLIAASFSACQQDACYSKDQFVRSYTEFFKEFDKNSDELTEKMIADYEARYEAMLENCYKKYKKELSYDEKKEFWQSSVSFYLEKEGGIFNIKFNDKEGEDPIRKFIVEELEAMSDSTSNEIASFLEDVLEDELPNLIDSFVDKVEEIGDEIKKSLEEEKDN